MARRLRLAKLTAPRLARILPRQRLFRLLDREVRRHRVFWIEAPPGAGKTALAASWLAARRLRHLWLSVDEADGDVAAFFHHLELGAEALGVGAGRLPVLAPEHLAAPHAFGHLFFRALLAARRGPRVIVLDDHHRLPEHSSVHAALAAGLAELPEGVSAVILSRSGPPPALARLRAAGTLGLFRAEELAITEREARGIACLWEVACRDRDKVRALHERSQGWAAGLALLLGAARLGRGAGPRLGAHQPLLDYFAEEVFSAAQPDTRKVLLETAFLPRFTAPMATTLTGLASAAGILEGVARRGYFLAWTDGDPTVYQCHALFREFLLHRAERELTPERRAELRRTASRLLEESGRLDDAYQLLAEGGAWEEAAGLVRRHGPSLLPAGRAETLRRWTAALPPEARDRDPWLLFLAGSARSVLEAGGAPTHLERAFDRFEADGDAAGAYLAWSAIVESHVLAFEDLSPLDRWIPALDALRVRFPDFPGLEIEERVVAAAIGALSFRQPWHPALPAWIEHGMRLALSASDARPRLHVVRCLALHCGSWGADLASARLLDDAVEALGPEGPGDPVTAVAWHVSASAREAFEGRLDAALREVERGLAASSRSGLRHLDMLLLQVRVWCLAARGDFAAADRALGQMSGGLHSPSLLQRCTYHHASALLTLLRGQAEEARKHGRTALDLAAALGAPLAEVMVRVPVALAAPPEERRGELEEALARARRCGAPLAEVGCLCALALESLRAGDVARGVGLLREGLGRAASMGVERIHWLSPAELSDLCGHALEHGVEPAFATAMIRAQGLLPGERAQEIEAWPWEVKVTTLGEFAVVSNGRRLASSRKAQRKPLELLRLLVARGRHGIRLDLAAEALWSGSDGDAARHALSTTVYRLRKLLGKAEAVVHEDGRIALDPRHVFVDSWAVERILDRAESRRAGSALAPAARAEVPGKVKELYRAGLLQDYSDEPFVAGAQQRLQERLARHLEEP